MDLKSSIHQMIHTHPFINKEVLFLSNEAHNIFEIDAPCKLWDLINYSVKHTLYEHDWQDGDMLLWDNVQVMHRAAGPFEGRRLLFRVQARMKFE